MTKRTTRNRRKRSSANKKKVTSTPLWARLTSFALIVLFLSIGFYQLKGLAFQVLYRRIVHRPTQGDFAGNQLRDAINYFHTIVENERNKERLLEYISQCKTVVWYNKKYSHARFPSYSPYDRFEFITPLQYDGNPDRRSNNYEIRFDGAYRFRHPDTALLKFESGTAIIENGFITSLTTMTRPNAYTTNWINWMYRHYGLACVLSAFVVTVLFFILSQARDKFTQLIFLMGRRLIGV